MVIVARDVDVPAFTDSGKRDVVSLRAGTEFREFRPFNPQHTICTARFGGHGMFYVVPADALTIRAEDPEEFTTIEEYYERMGLSEEKPEGKSFPPRFVTTEPVGVDPDVVRRLLTDPMPGTRSMPSGVRRENLGETKVEYLDPLGRFLFIRQPFLINKRGMKVRENPGTGEPEPSPHTISKFDGYIQSNDGLYYFFVWRNILYDTVRGNVTTADNKGAATRKMEEILETERSLEEAELAEHRGFQLRRRADPATGLFAYEISVPGSPPLRTDEVPATIDEAKRYVDSHIESLIQQAAPYLT